MSTDADKPAVLKLVSDPLAAAQLEKLRIALTRQISRHGWRLMATALQAACEHGAMHQRGNARAAALWRWRAQMFRQLAMQGQPPNQDCPPALPRPARHERGEGRGEGQIINRKS